MDSLTVLNVRDQHGRAHIERSGQLVEHRDRRIARHTFEVRDVRPMHSGLERQLLLGPATLGAQALHIECKALPNVHVGRRDALSTIHLQTIRGILVDRGAWSSISAVTDRRQERYDERYGDIGVGKRPVTDRGPLKPATEVQKLRFILGLVIIVAVGFAITRCSEIMERNQRIYGSGSRDISLYRVAAQDIVKQRLRDPGSAEFRDLKVVLAHDGKPTVVCGRVNSRNGFGGMSGPQRFIAGESVTIEDGVNALDISQLWAERC